MVKIIQLEKVKLNPIGLSWYLLINKAFIRNGYINPKKEYNIKLIIEENQEITK